MHAPLIVTLKLDPVSHAFFDQLRQTHFPKARNHLAAHLTLFHHLPGEHRDRVEQQLAELAARPPIALQVTGPYALGRGVAYRLASPELTAFHVVLQKTFDAWLTPQDRQRLSPHVTVQNKVTPDAARSLLDVLRADFQPFEATGLGWQLWHYRNGPWEWASDHLFHHSD